MIHQDFDTDVSLQYADCQNCLSVDVLPGGHINDTFLAHYQSKVGTHSLIHQRINPHVFKNIPCVIENMVRVTEHARVWFASNNVTNPGRRVQSVYPTMEGHYYWQDTQGGYWRTHNYIDGVYTRAAAQSADEAYEASFAFGMFQRVVSGLDKPRLHETIPDFHNTPKRFLAFEEVVKKDGANRLRMCSAEVETLLLRKSWHADLHSAWLSGYIPERVVHNDAKVGNVLFDSETSEGLTVIDLDTVMPGLSAHDYGDLIRSTACTGAEDEQDLDKVFIDVDLFRAVTHGFLAGAGPLLSKKEHELMFVGAKTIILEQATRFLKDYLEGDVYFRTGRLHHNLDRARTQIALLQSLEVNDARFIDLIKDGPTYY